MTVSGKPILGPNGEFLGYRGTATDQTGMVEALQKAERAEALLRDAVESIAEGFVIFDRDDRFVTCNEIYRQTYTYGRELLVPGARFEEVARAIVTMGQIPIARGREAEWVFEERMRLHRELTGSIGDAAALLLDQSISGATTPLFDHSAFIARRDLARAVPPRPRRNSRIADAVIAHDGNVVAIF